MAEANGNVVNGNGVNGNGVIGNGVIGNGANLVVFPQENDFSFFMCHCCGNHLVTLANASCRIPAIQTLVCRDPVNVTLGYQLRAVPLYNNMFLEVRDVSCTQCGLPLGEFFVGMPGHVPAEQIYQPNTYQFALYKLLYWNGNHVVYASTGQEVA